MEDIQPIKLSLPATVEELLAVTESLAVRIQEIEKKVNELWISR